VNYALGQRTSYSFNVYNDKKRHTIFLLGLYKLSGGNPQQSVETAALSKEIDMIEPEIALVANFLKAKKLVEFSNFNFVNITHEGTIEADKIMTERFEEKERRVLQKFYDERERHPRGIHPDELSLVLNMELSDVHKVISELDDKNWTGGTDDLSWISPAGIKEIEKLPEPQRQTPINVMHIGTNYGAAAVGSNITQSATLTNNPDFDRAIAGLLQLIQSSQLPSDEIEELQEEVVKLNKLAITAPKPGLLEKAKARIDFVKLGLQGTELLVKAAPLLQTTWDHFSK
jgi:hypothetical protein